MCEPEIQPPLLVEAQPKIHFPPEHAASFDVDAPTEPGDDARDFTDAT